jgi:hypothetical protein
MFAASDHGSFFSATRIQSDLSGKYLLEAPSTYLEYKRGPAALSLRKTKKWTARLAGALLFPSSLEGQLFKFRRMAG